MCKNDRIWKKRTFEITRKSLDILLNSLWDLIDQSVYSVHFRAKSLPITCVRRCCFEIMWPRMKIFPNLSVWLRLEMRILNQKLSKCCRKSSLLEIEKPAKSMWMPKKRKLVCFQLSIWSILNHFFFKWSLMSCAYILHFTFRSATTNEILGTKRWGLFQKLLLSER